MDEDEAARLALSYLAGQQLLLWPAELLSRYFHPSEDVPSFTELSTVAAYLEQAIELAPEELAQPLQTLVAPLRQIRSQIIDAAINDSRDMVEIYVDVDSAAMGKAALDALWWMTERGYERQTDSDVPDTIPDDWTT
jgi:hypothetical protein